MPVPLWSKAATPARRMPLHTDIFNCLLSEIIISTHKESKLEIMITSADSHLQTRVQSLGPTVVTFVIFYFAGYM